jgi:hypothetical protein
MPSNAILREVTQLYNVSDRLDSLAEQTSSSKHADVAQQPR